MCTQWLYIRSTRANTTTPASEHCCCCLVHQALMLMRYVHTPLNCTNTTTAMCVYTTNTSRFQIWRGKRGNGQLLCPPRVTPSVGGVVILPRTGLHTFETLAGTAEAVRSYFQTDFPTAFGPNGPSKSFCEEFSTRPAGSLKTTYCDRLADGHVALVSVM
jgi:hypothetical protein